MNNNELHCIFCQKVLDNQLPEPANLASWWECYYCNIFFFVNGNHASIDYKLKMEDDSHYNLFINLTREITRITFWKAKSGDPKEILYLPYIIYDVTPSNLKSKIFRLLNLKAFL